MISVFSICLWNMKDSGEALMYLLCFLEPKNRTWYKTVFQKMLSEHCWPRFSLTCLNATPEREETISQSWHHQRAQPALKVSFSPQSCHFLTALRTVRSGLFLHRPIRAKVLGYPNSVGTVLRFVAEVGQNIFRGSSVTLVLTEFCLANQCIRSCC